VWVPWLVPAGITVDVLAVPAAPIAELDPVRTVPVGESRRNVTVSPVANWASVPVRVAGSAVIAAVESNAKVGAAIVTELLADPRVPTQFVPWTGVIAYRHVPAGTAASVHVRAVMVPVHALRMV